MGFVDCRLCYLFEHEVLLWLVAITTVRFTVTGRKGTPPTMDQVGNSYLLQALCRLQNDVSKSHKTKYIKASRHVLRTELSKGRGHKNLTRAKFGHGCVCAQHKSKEHIMGMW